MLATSVSNWPGLFFTSILYPVMAEPPVFDGADHDRLIWVEDADVAARPVGVPGGFMFDWDCGGVEVVSGVADASFEIGLAPKVK